MIPQHGTLEISRSRLLHNLALIRQQLGPRTQICATLKANAYGHGANLIMQLLLAADVHWFAVYNLEEALALTSPGIAIPGPSILTLAPFVLSNDDPLPINRPSRKDERRKTKDEKDRAHRAEKLRIQNLNLLATLPPQIRLNIIDPDSATLLAHHLSSQNRPLLNIHIQIDTGLTRSGAASDSVPQLANVIAQLPQLRLEGLFAHFSHADVPNHPTMREQSQRFHAVADPLKQKFPHLLLHTHNSAGAFHFTDNALDLARIGIALYGLQPSTAYPFPVLQPIAQLTAPILAIHNVPPNTGAGYGHTFITTRPSRLAIVPAGYADGIPRILSHNAVAQIRNRAVPIVGRISMDQIILDITDLPAAGLADPVTLISQNSADPNSLDRMADAAHTIPYELATHLGPRLHRQLID